MHDFDGIRLQIYEEAGEDHLNQVIAALSLIKALDPRTYALVARLLPGGIAVIEPVENWAHYHPERKACCLSYDFLEAKDVQDVCLTIVHELCHARLMHCGIGYEESIRVRVEKICMRRELAFARLLERHRPGPHDYVSEVSSRIEDIAHDIYTDAAFQWAARQDSLRNLRRLKALGAPSWLRRCVGQNIRRRWRREKTQSPQAAVPAP